MIRNVLHTALTGVAVSLAAAALAAPPSGGGGAGAGASVNAGVQMSAPSQIGAGVTVNGQGSLNASPRAMDRSTTKTGIQVNTTNDVTTRAAKSQGPLNASPTGIAHASPNSVLARGSVASSTLPGLTTGLTVNNSAGTSIGTVSQIVTDTSGNIRLVIVTSPSGQTFRLAPTTLSISGGVVTTTSTTVGG